MTEKGAAFVSRMKIAAQLAQTGTSVFAAMAASLEDEDWTLVYVAACKLARDVESQADAQA